MFIISLNTVIKQREAGLKITGALGEIYPFIILIMAILSTVQIIFMISKGKL